MLINPEKNKNLKNFLNDLYSKISFLTSALNQDIKSIDEYKWAIVLDYILLKCCGNNTLSSFLRESLPEIFENYKQLMLFKLKNSKIKQFKQLIPKEKEFYFSFFKNFLVNPLILRQNLFKMRTDIDLKILFFLFGGNFFPQEQEHFDGTGALYYVKEDFKSKSELFISKLNILKNHLFQNTSNNKVPCIALNKGQHWVALNSIEGKILSLNDPRTKKTLKLRILHHIPKNFRFYLFDYNPENPPLLKKNFMNFFKLEVEKERKSLKKHTKELESLLLMERGSLNSL
ncbi:MAG: hypothetical protein ACFFAN_09565 [Promethearchaeota archaeon]